MQEFGVRQYTVGKGLENTQRKLMEDQGYFGRVVCTAPFQHQLSIQ